MSFGIVASKYRRSGSGRPTTIDGLPVIQTPGKLWYVDGNVGASGDGTSWDAAFKTVAEGVSAQRADEGDYLFVAPLFGGYDEAEVIFSKRAVKIFGVGPLASVYLHNTSGPGAAITADEVELYNFGVEGSSGYGIEVRDAVEEFKAFYSKFGLSEGAGPAVRLTGAGPVLMDYCEYAWADTGIEFKGGLTSFPTQISITRSRFHNLVVAHLDRVAGAKVVNLRHIGNDHDNLEAGTEPTGRFIRVDVAGSSGLIARNKFATASNASAKFVLNADGLMKWVANETEAGVSAARPA